MGFNQFFVEIFMNFHAVKPCAVPQLQNRGLERLNSVTAVSNVLHYTPFFSEITLYVHKSVFERIGAGDGGTVLNKI